MCSFPTYYMIYFYFFSTALAVHKFATAKCLILSFSRNYINLFHLGVSFSHGYNFRSAVLHDSEEANPQSPRMSSS